MSVEIEENERPGEECRERHEPDHSAASGCEQRGDDRNRDRNDPNPAQRGHHCLHPSVVADHPSLPERPAQALVDRAVDPLPLLVGAGDERLVRMKRLDGVAVLGPGVGDDDRDERQRRAAREEGGPLPGAPSATVQVGDVHVDRERDQQERGICCRLHEACKASAENRQQVIVDASLVHRLREEPQEGCAEEEHRGLDHEGPAPEHMDGVHEHERDEDPAGTRILPEEPCEQEGWR